MPQERRIEFRIGINVGDVMIDRGDVFGDSVNVAARLEGLAEAGGICVSRRVLEDVQRKLEIAFEDAGEQQLKNIEGSVRVYRLRLGGAAATRRPALPLPDKPSIAVLPFQNMSGDPEQEYFADGIVEDLIMALSRFRWLFVIARNSSFTYKGRAVDVKRVGRELGVRYVLEGSVRKAGNLIRIAGQLIDASTGAHLWADRFDGELKDIFDLQDQVTARVVTVIAPKLVGAEIERAQRKPTDRLDAYDYYLRGEASSRPWTREANSEALRLYCKAIELDPDFASAYGRAAFCYVQRKARGWMINRDQEIAEGARLAKLAVRLARDDAVALCWGGYALAYLVHDLESGATFLNRALTLNPNDHAAWALSGWVKAWLGEPEAAIQQLAHAMRLSPLDPLTFVMQAAIGFAHFLAGRYDEGSSWAERALRERPDFLLALVPAAVNNALAGYLSAAQRATTALRRLNPSLRISNIGDLIPLRRPEDLARLAEGLRKAGLPE